MNDETRTEMLKKIDSKKGAAEKKAGKPSNMGKMKKTYVKAIADYQEKIAKLREMIAVLEKNEKEAKASAAAGQAEVDHMEEIVKRYDLAVEELPKQRKAMVDVVEEYGRNVDIDSWTPGQESHITKAQKDKRYLKAQERVAYLEEVIEACPTDVMRIFYSRGAVSEFNAKGRKGV